jgi:hypothetical protein
MHSKQKASFWSRLRAAMAVASLVVGLSSWGVAAVTGYNAIAGTAVVHAADDKDPPPPDPPATPAVRYQVDANCAKGQCIIDNYLRPAINTLSALVGVAVVISLIVAGIQYSTSADNSQAVSAAKQRMVTAVMVLVGYFSLYAFLNWVIPGGLASL